MTKTTEAKMLQLKLRMERILYSGVTVGEILHLELQTGKCCIGELQLDRNSVSEVTEGKNTAFGEYGMKNSDTETTEGKTSDSEGKLSKNHGRINLHTVRGKINYSRENSVIGM